jgi:hypothetical protein
MVFRNLICSGCDFNIKGCLDPYLYALIDNEKHVLAHPLEESELAKLTKLSWEKAAELGLIQHVFQCICFDCSGRLNLDVEREVKRCNKCESYNVKTFRSCLGSECPACHSGKLMFDKNFVMIS